MEFQEEELNEILAIFQQESLEIISSADSKLLALGAKGSNSELAMQLFRDMHSLKGSARMLGFEEMQNLAHKIEDIISLVREEKLTMTADIADCISEVLEFISDLINKTVAQKSEYKSPQTQEYLEKLDKIALSGNSEAAFLQLNEEDIDKKDFLEKFPKIEDLILEMLLILSKARKKNNFDNVGEIKDDINYFLELLRDNEGLKIKEIVSLAQGVARTVEDFLMTDNKPLSFLEVNSSVMALVEAICGYTNKEHIKRKDYFEIVDSEIAKLEQTLEVEDKSGEIVQRLPLMELNCNFYGETLDIIGALVAAEKNPKIKAIYLDIKEIVELFKNHSSVLSHEASSAIKETLEALKNPKTSFDETSKKIDIIKTMLKFQYDDKHGKKHISETNQREILNSITNTEIKTLRVESAKLDNLVGQIRELIVSKIKTNEQMSLAKKISYDLAEWQKNFAKMDYYIKYFDKKYLSNPMAEQEWDYRTVSAYNRQLCVLAAAHEDKIQSIMLEMGNLYKQLQESETKLNSTTSEIESMVKNMRILPLSTIFQLFPRMIHNIAKEKNKKIDVVIKGESTTADKTIIEEMKIPLMHIIRNSIDHGIEDMETRRALGKNPVGKIEIIATHRDNKVIIDVKDDGKGLDIEKIKAKALDMKILTQDELSAIADEELTNLIFYPGFSTEDFVTELSGRGLGLDIVNTKINQMQGRIDIFSQINKGTIVRLTLPATVATKKVFVIEEQEQLYAIETSVIKTIVRINNDDIFEKDGNNYYIYDNNAVVIYTLSQILNLKHAIKETNKYTLMIIETDNTIFGIVVEKLISDQEIVHKKLAPPLYRVQNISGITTLANGEACLILNVSDIISTISSIKIGSKIISKNGIIKTKDNFNYKILVVDDSHTTRILQKNILANHGYNVSIATNPKNALEKASKDAFDLVITDVQMPVMNGFEFAFELRKLKNYATCPVVVVSSEPKQNHIKDIERTGAAAYIQKNTFKQEDYLSVIESLLG